MSCPNCGNRGRCYCTWDEMGQAIAIRRRREAERRRRMGQRTVIEEEAERKARKARR